MMGRFARPNVRGDGCVTLFPSSSIIDHIPVSPISPDHHAPQLPRTIHTLSNLVRGGTLRRTLAPPYQEHCHIVHVVLDVVDYDSIVILVYDLNH